MFSYDRVGPKSRGYVCKTDLPRGCGGGSAQVSSGLSACAGRVCSSNSCARAQCVYARIIISDGWKTERNNRRRKRATCRTEGGKTRGTRRGHRQSRLVVSLLLLLLFISCFACTARGMFGGRRRAGAHALLADEDIFFSMYVYVVYVIRRDSKHERRRRGERYGRRETCTRACARQD